LSWSSDVMIRPPCPRRVAQLAVRHLVPSFAMFRLPQPLPAGVLEHRWDRFLLGGTDDKQRDG